MKMKKFKHNVLLALSFALMSIADISVSTATVIIWHEPECPKELLK